MRLFFLIGALFLAFLSPGNAQIDTTQAVEGVEARRALLEEFAKEIEEDEAADYLSLREQLRAIRTEAIASSRPMRDRLREVEDNLAILGRAPQEGATEPAEIAAQRSRLLEESAAIGQILAQADLNISRSSRLLQDISALRREAFYLNILKRGALPISPSVWGPAIQSFRDGHNSFTSKADKWLKDRKTADRPLMPIWALLAALIFAVVMFGPARRWVDATFLRRIEAVEPTPTTRMTAAGIRTLARAIPGVIGGWVVMETARAQGLISPATEPLALAIWFGLLGLLVADGMATAVYAPKLQNWRLIPLISTSAARVRVLILSAATLLFVDALLKAGAEFLGSTEELSRLQGAIVATIGAGLLWLFCRKSLWRLDEQRVLESAGDASQRWHALRRIIASIAILAVPATLTGYVALAQYAVTRIFLIAGVLAFVWFVRVLVQQTIDHFRSKAAAKARVDEAISEEGENLFFFWISIVIDLLLIGLAAPVFLVVIGVEWFEVRDWIKDAFFGFKVGAITISIAQILGSILTFALILFATRFVQRSVDKRYFAKSKLDEGVRNSFRTLLGYAGLVFGVVTAIALLGVNLTNLALIAGALSVGIGFGLQSIVNNFVSGLILLFERPIKVGDWIVVASGEGIVKRISVRSTEIETFDRSSIIVPNSELVSSAVTNWTHKDKYTRIIVPVGVSYKEDPERVMDILKGVIAENKRVVKFPEPFVYFGRFGDSSLDFELRIFIRQINDRIIVQNELRVATFKAFKEAGIEIPFPQRDLHLKTTFPLSTETSK